MHILELTLVYKILILVTKKLASKDIDFYKCNYVFLLLLIVLNYYKG
jgi:hypothetical protein